jgi:uncharacterized membrane protein YdjX (TVP38/TMEM64 family)
MTDFHGPQAAAPADTEPATPTVGLRAVAKVATLVVLLILAFVGLRFTGAADHVSKQGIQTLVSGFGLLAPVVHVAVYAVGTTALLPATLFTLIGAVLFGKVLGTVYNLAGATSGAALSFLTARYLGRDFAARLLRGKKLQRLDAKAEDHGFILISYLRLAYFPFAPLNYAAGLTRIRFLDYLGGSALGMLPGMLLFTCFLDELASLGSPSDLLASRFLTPLTLLVASFFLPVLVRRLSPALNSTPSPPRT